MRALLSKLWRDDKGVVAFEYLLVGTIIGLGLVVGLAAVSVALNAELTELSQAISAIDQSYSFAAQSTCVSQKNGSSGQHTPTCMSYQIMYGEGTTRITYNPTQTIYATVCP
jgi:Flp pilus assembly pilin Flp